MQALKLPIGNDIFKKLREDGAYYVDKTGFIEELLSPHLPLVSLITRPRRFGKSLNMSMLAEFFDYRKKSAPLFQGLYIAGQETLCSTWMNTFPVLSLSLKNIEGASFSHALAQFSELIQTLCDEHFYLLSSPRVSALMRKKLQSCYNGKASEVELENALFTLCRALASHTDKSVIVLIDEYDVPLTSAFKNSYYAEMTAFVRALFGSAFKTNPYLKFALCTGCLRIAHESIFTGLNNFKCYSLDHPKYADKFGFTAKEVTDLLTYAGIPEKRTNVQAWYDGYRFGSVQEIYCPWDVLNFIDDCLTDSSFPPQSYWSNTSSNDILLDFLRHTEFSIKDKWCELLQGGHVFARITENLTFDELYVSEDHFWTILYFTGYLTRTTNDAARKDMKTALVIPNQEIHELFVRAANSWFTEHILRVDRSIFFAALWNEEADVLEKELNRFLAQSISYFDSHEDFCHGFLNGIFFNAGYDVTANYESGSGRPDLIVYDSDRNRVVIIEVKHTKDATLFPSLPQKALKQIQSMQYAQPFTAKGIQHILAYAIAFHKKECLVQSRRLA